MPWRAATLVFVSLALLPAASAHAGIASVVGSTLTYAAGSGETNTVSIAYDSSLGYRITDTTAPVSGGPGCGAIGHEVDCEAGRVQLIVVNLRDGNDKWLGGAINVVPSVDGGSGDDDLEGIGFLSGGDGNDTLKGLDSGVQLDGGNGNDLVVGGEGNDVLDGGPGDDLLIGNDGNDTLTGGPGLDRIDASGDGTKVVDCQHRDDEIIQAGEVLQRRNCSAAPRVQIKVPSARHKRLLTSGLPFTVGCDRPCAVYWELTLGPKLLTRHTSSIDADGFRAPAAGPQKFSARAANRGTRVALRRLKGFTVTLGVQVWGRDGLSSKQFRTIRVR